MPKTYYIFYYRDQFTTPFLIGTAESFEEANQIMIEDHKEHGRLLINYEITLRHN